MQIEDLIELAKRVQAQQAEAQTVEVKAAHRALARKLQISLALEPCTTPTSATFSRWLSRVGWNSAFRINRPAASRRTRRTFKGLLTLYGSGVFLSQITQKGGRSFPNPIYREIYTINMKGKRRKSKGKCRCSSVDVMPSLPKQCRNVSARSETSCCFNYLMWGKLREVWRLPSLHAKST